MKNSDILDSYYENGKLKEYFDCNLVIAKLLEEEIVECYAGTRGETLFVLKCSDTFGYGCVDLEDVPFNEIGNLYKWYLKDDVYGTIVWVSLRRKKLPNNSIIKSMSMGNFWPKEMQNLQKELGR